MGATGSVLQQLESEGGGEGGGAATTINKERCQELTGNAFTDELWIEHSIDGLITKDKLIELSNTLYPEDSIPTAYANAKLEVVDDASYEGERNEQGQKHGHGKFTYENGEIGG